MAQESPGGAGFAGLAGLKLAQPEPERPGDRALGCAEISAEMGRIMQRRNVSSVAHSSKRKLCHSKDVLDRQAAEQQHLQQSQTAGRIAASAAPQPTARAMHATMDAETVALNQSQQADRNAATSDMVSGSANMLGVMNDGRLMRLSVLSQGRHCAANAPPPSEPAEGACDEGPPPRGKVQSPVRPGASSGAVNPMRTPDPFAQSGKRSAAGAASAAADPFAHR